MPIIAEVKADTKTAPAEISLANFAPGWGWFVKWSTTDSMAVFVSSKEITNPIRKMIIIQSCLEIFNMNDKTITKRPAKK